MEYNHRRKKKQFDYSEYKKTKKGSLRVASNNSKMDKELDDTIDDKDAV